MCVQFLGFLAFGSDIFFTLALKFVRFAPRTAIEKLLHPMRFTSQGAIQWNMNVVRCEESYV